MKKLMMVVLGLTCMAGMAVAGQIDSPGVPGSAASKMPALGDIYTYLTTGTPVPTPGESFTEPSSAPGSTGHTLTEIYAAVATPLQQCDATAADVKSGKKFFCTVAGSWGVQTGSAQSVTPTPTPDPWYVQHGPDGDNTVVKIGTLYVAKGTTSAGTGNGATKAWQAAIDWTNSLNWLDKVDWKLPSNSDLASICTNKSLLGSYTADNYWSSTVVDGNTTQAYITYFGSGAYECYQQGYAKTYPSWYVRAVRDTP